MDHKVQGRAKNKASTSRGDKEENEWLRASNIKV